MVWDERGPVSWPHLLLAFPSFMLQAHLCWQEEGENEPGIGCRQLSLGSSGEGQGSTIFVRKGGRERDTGRCLVFCGLHSDLVLSHFIIVSEWQ